MAGISSTEEVKRRSRQCTDKARPALEKLSGIATNYQKDDTAKQVSRIATEMEKQMFRLIVLGRFKNGKSTFMNALLGRPTCPIEGIPLDCGPMPSHDLPCTAILTSVQYSEKPQVTVLKKDEYRKKGHKDEVWSFQQYLHDSKVRSTKGENEKFFDPIQESQMLFPATLCQMGITLIDSPGTDEDLTRDLITLEAAHNASAAIAMFRSDSLAGMQELEYVRNFIDSGLKSPFLIINLWADRKVDKELKSMVWDKLVTQMQGGPPFNGEELDSRNIYFVDAKKALRAKLTGDGQLLVDSGMAYFEDRLMHFLEKDKLSVHMQTFVERARYYAEEIRDEINRRLPALQMEQNQLQLNYARIKPELERIKARQARIPDIINRYRERCKFNLKTGFEELINELCFSLQEGGELYNDIMAIELPSLKSEGILDHLLAGVKAPFLRKKLSQEASEIACKKVQVRIEKWQKAAPDNPGLPQIFGDISTAMMTEIEEEVARIQRDFQSAQFEFTGVYTTDGQETDVVKPGMTGRVVGVAWGALTGSPDMIFTGGTQGWGGLARDMAGRFGAATILLWLGAPLGVVMPVVMLVGFLVNAAFGGRAVQKQILKGIIKFMLEGNPEEKGKGSLKSGMNHMKPLLDQAVDKLFDRVLTAVTQEVKEAMREEEQKFERQLNDSHLSLVEKEKKLAEVQKDLSEIEKCKVMFNDALVVAKCGVA